MNYKYRDVDIVLATEWRIFQIKIRGATVIHIKGVAKSFNNLQVLKGIDLDIDKGKTFGIVGRSGAGKSTLLRCINGLEKYDEGTLIVDGVDLKTLSEKDILTFRKDIGMIFQHFSLLNRLSVYENIALPLKCWKYSNSYIEKRVKGLLEIIGIPDKINVRPTELSGGQKQRVAIARSLAMEPKILLCDEATSALDPKTAQSIVTLLNQINEDLGITIIVVTHQMSILRSACEEIAILENGKVEAQGAVDKVFLEQPPALKNLIGYRDILLPDTGINIEIFFSKESASSPIITKMARNLNVDFIILGGEMERYKNSPLGSIIVNVSIDEYDKVERYLKSNNIVWKVFEQDGQAMKEVNKHQYI